MPELDLTALLAEPARRAGIELRSLVALARAGAVGVELPHACCRSSPLCATTVPSAAP
jgi:hypothetical protein